MKTKVLMFVVGVFALFTACSNDDDNDKTYSPGTQVLEAFQAKYPMATGVKWENDNGYAQADFILDGKSCEAWFSSSGEWLFTDTDLMYNQLPADVQTAFKSGPYADWTVDDVDQIEQLNVPVLYRLEVEQGQNEMVLYYDEEGNLKKEANENGVSNLPSAITSFIRQKYPQSAIVNSDVLTDGRKTVDILNGNRVKEVLFTANNEWIQTQWSVLLTELPQPVVEALQGEAFTGYTQVGAQFRQYASGDDVYRVQLSKTGSLDMFVEIYADGSFFLN